MNYESLGFIGTVWLFSVVGLMVAGWTFAGAALFVVPFIWADFF